MKKIVALIAVICIFLFCGCQKSTLGSVYELTSSSWYAKLDGGAEVSLEFDGDTAEILIKNAGERSNIKGKYVADESDFVIFVPEISQNYAFEYVSKNSTLELTLNSHTVTLNKVA